MAKAGGGGTRRATVPKTVSKTALSPKRYVRPRAIMGGTVVGLGGAGVRAAAGGSARGVMRENAQFLTAGLANQLAGTAKRLASQSGYITPSGPKTKRKGFKKKRPTP